MSIITFKQFLFNNWKEYTGRKFLIMCPGKNVLSASKDLIDFIDATKPVIVGINHMDLVIPEIHVYTNNQRISKYGQFIHPKTKHVMIGKYVREIPANVKDHIYISYTDRIVDEPIKYQSGCFYGYYRSCTCLAMMIMHTIGASQIYVAGMDGFTYHNAKESIHSYEDDVEDRKTAEEWKKYDDIIEKVLYNLQSHRVNFSIITPTVYSNFYKEIL